MALRDFIIDPATLDLSHVIADEEQVRAHIPQRYEMQQLSAVVYEDGDAGVVAGYKDITEQDFWVRGHMPGFPLMPGIIMCEAAAQLSSWLVSRHNWFNGQILGFGGLDKVKFRGLVVPGQRLVIVAQRLKFRAGALIRCRFQCFVNNEVVCEGELNGVPLPGTESYKGG